MSELPESVLECVRKSIEEHPSNNAQAAACAEQRIKKLKIFDDIVDDLFHDYVQKLVYDQRHKLNGELRAEARARGQHPEQKVRVGESPTVRSSYADLYLFRVGGKTLGEIKGEELEALADREHRTAEGYLGRAALLRSLMPLVKPDKTVEECVKGKKLQELFEEANLA